MRLVRSAGSTGKKRCRRSPSARLASGPALERPREFGAFRRTRSEREAHPARCAAGYAWPRGFRESEGDSPLGISRGFSPGDRRRRLDGEKCRRLAIKRVLARSNPPRRRRSRSRRHTPRAPRVAPLARDRPRASRRLHRRPASRTRPRPRRGFPSPRAAVPGRVDAQRPRRPSPRRSVSPHPLRAARCDGRDRRVWIPAVGLAAPRRSNMGAAASRAALGASTRVARSARRAVAPSAAVAPSRRARTSPRAPSSAARSRHRVVRPRDLSRAPRHRRLVASAAPAAATATSDDDAPLSSEETARLDAEAAEFASDWAAELSAAAWTDAGEAPEGDRSSDEASQVRERESNDPVTEPVTDARRKGARATRRKRATPPPRVLT